MNSGAFTVVDRARLNQVLAEIGSQASDLFDPDAQVKIGKLLGPFSFVAGRVRVNNYEERVSRSAATASEGGRERRVVTYTRTGVMKVGVLLTVTDLGTGKILLSRELRAEASAENTEVNRQPPRIDAQRLADSCWGRVIEEFMRALLPRQESIAVRLFRGDGWIELAGIDEYDQGIEHAGAAQWERAEASFRSGIDRLSRDPEASDQLVGRGWYNCARALQFRAMAARPDDGLFQAALEAFDKAMQHDRDPLFSRARAECEAAIDDSRQLRSQVESREAS